MQSLKPDMPDHRELVVDVNVHSEMKTILSRDLPKVTETLDSLRKEESKEAVKVISLLFSCKCKEYRTEAIETLGKMKSEHAKKVLLRRASWLSCASKEEKKLIRMLLANERGN